MQFSSQCSTTHMIYFVRQLQEKYEEQNVPLHIAFIYLTRASNTVSRKGLFAILLNIDCHPRLFNIVKFFPTNTKATVQYDGNVSESCTTKSGVCPFCNCFQDFSNFLVKRTFCSSTVRVKLPSISDGCLFNPAVGNQSER